MIDKSVVQEVQKELVAAVQRGHEQIRKGQDRVRKGQEQVRKSRDAVTGVVTELSKSVRPNLPTVHIPTADVRKHVRELASHAITVQHDMADRARRAGIPEQVAAAQRTLAGKVMQAAKAAAPFVAEGRARLSQVVGARSEASQSDSVADGTPAVVAPEAKRTAPKAQTTAPKAGATGATGTSEPPAPKN